MNQDDVLQTARSFLGEYGSLKKAWRFSFGVYRRLDRIDREELAREHRELERAQRQWLDEQLAADRQSEHST